MKPPILSKNKLPKIELIVPYFCSVISPDNGEEILCWSNWDQGFVKAAFYYGYPLTQLIGGWMAQRHSIYHILGQ